MAEGEDPQKTPKLKWTDGAALLSMLLTVVLTRTDDPAKLVCGLILACLLGCLFIWFGHAELPRRSRLGICTGIVIAFIGFGWFTYPSPVKAAQQIVTLQEPRHSYDPSFYVDELWCQMPSGVTPQVVWFCEATDDVGTLTPLMRKTKSDSIRWNDWQKDGKVREAIQVTVVNNFDQPLTHIKLPLDFIFEKPPRWGIVPRSKFWKLKIKDAPKYMKSVLWQFPTGKKHPRNPYEVIDMEVDAHKDSAFVFYILNESETENLSINWTREKEALTQLAALHRSLLKSGTQPFQRWSSCRRFLSSISRP